MHVGTELLALLALGERAGTEDERAHVDTCPVCSAQLAELEHVVALARSAVGLRLDAPDPQVWEAVRAEVGRAGGGPGAPQEPTAHARLAPVAAAWAEAGGEADLSTDARGRRILQVALDAELPQTGIRQAWLVHRDDPGRRQTLGILDGRLGLWTVAHAVDLDEFVVLDISQQAIGSTEHSGDTIVRGELVYGP